MVKHHKKKHNKKKSSSSSPSSNSVQQANAQQNHQAHNSQQTAQSNDQGSQNQNGEQVYTAHPSQGGTIYQTNGNAGSFQGDPDTIANTQRLMEQSAQRIANGQQ